MLNKSRYKYYAVKIENAKRETQLINKPVYQSSEIIKFNTATFDDIINKNTLVESYVARIFQ